MGRATTNTTPVGALYYQYDLNGNLTSLASATANGVSVTYQYDALNRTTNVIDNRLSGTKNTSYTFDGVGNLATLKYPNGLTNLWQYDSLNRLTNLTWKLNGAQRGDFTYQIGVAGNRTNLADNVNGSSRSFTWQYDPLYRLTSEVVTGAAPTGSLGYTYDDVGNKLSRTGSLGPLGTAGWAYTTNDWLTVNQYDNNGNTITNSSNQPYAYDYANRLTSFNNGTATFVYDAAGNRVKKTAGGFTTIYLVATVNPTGYPKVMEELTVSGTTNLSRVYAYGLDLMSVRETNGVVHFYGYDGLGSVRFLTDTNGAISDTYVYDAFGTKIASTGSTVNNYRYTGEQWDGDLGFYYLRARYMNPNTGRFWTMDSFEGSQTDPLSLHKYLYVGDNPVNNIDPSGNETLPSLMTGFTIHAIGFRTLVGAAVGVWDANFRGYSAWQGLSFGAVGGAFGPLIPWQLGVTLTAYGIADALEDGNYPSALFRGATAVVGAGSFRWSSRLPGGRLGGLNTQLQNSRLAAYLTARGWRLRGGGGVAPEERIPGLGGGRKGETWVDITAEKSIGGTIRTIRIQTIDTLANGAPTPRELSAASRIRAAFPGDRLLLVPKTEQGLPAPPPLIFGSDEDEQ